MARPGEDQPAAAPGADRPSAEEPAAAPGKDQPAASGAATPETYGADKARSLLRMFREDTGRDAESARELSEWMIRRNR